MAHETLSGSIEPLQKSHPLFLLHPPNTYVYIHTKNRHHLLGPQFYPPQKQSPV